MFSPKHLITYQLTPVSSSVKEFHLKVMLLDVTLLYLKLLGANTIMKILLLSNENDYIYSYV